MSVIDEDVIQVSVLYQQLISDGEFLLQELLENAIVSAKGIAKLQRKILKEISVLTKVGVTPKQLNISSKAYSKFCKKHDTTIA